MTYLVRDMTADATRVAAKPDEQSTIAQGETKRGTIDHPGEQDVYTFTAQGGDVAYFRADPGCVGSKLAWAVQSADGYDIALGPTVCQDVGRVRFTKTGSYQLVVHSTEGSTGPYTVSWDRALP